jgi:hypothetical protein
LFSSFVSTSLSSSCEAWTFFFDSESKIVPAVKLVCLVGYFELLPGPEGLLPASLT